MSCHTEVAGRVDADRHPLEQPEEGANGSGGDPAPAFGLGLASSAKHQAQLSDSQERPARD